MARTGRWAPPLAPAHLPQPAGVFEAADRLFPARIFISRRKKPAGFRRITPVFLLTVFFRSLDGLSGLRAHRLAAPHTVKGQSLTFLQVLDSLLAFPSTRSTGSIRGSHILRAGGNFI